MNTQQLATSQPPCAHALPLILSRVTSRDHHKFFLPLEIATFPIYPPKSTPVLLTPRDRHICRRLYLEIDMTWDYSPKSTACVCAYPGIAVISDYSSDSLVFNDDWPHHSWSARDVWAKTDLGVFTETVIHNLAHDSWHLSRGITVLVPAHGVRLLRMVPMAPEKWRVSH